jgi:hypothetical protein
MRAENIDKAPSARDTDQMASKKDGHELDAPIASGNGRGLPKSAWREPKALTELFKAATLLLLIVVVVSHWRYLSIWLNTATHFEFAGLKIDRKTVDARLEALAKSPERSELFSLMDAQEAVTLGYQLWPSLNGARVLWVDPNPDHNVAVQDFFELYGMRFDHAANTKDAFKFLEARKPNPYDLVITSSRATEAIDAGAGGEIALKLCPVAYSEWPTGDLPRNLIRHKDDTLLDFNRKINQTPIAGFYFIEAVHASFPEIPLILYSASNGGISTCLCAKTTNSTNVLLREAMLSLAHKRWMELKKVQAPYEQ